MKKKPMKLMKRPTKRPKPKRTKSRSKREACDVGLDYDAVFCTPRLPSVITEIEIRERHVSYAEFALAAGLEHDADTEEILQQIKRMNFLLKQSEHVISKRDQTNTALQKEARVFERKSKRWKAENARLSPDTKGN